MSVSSGKMPLPMRRASLHESVEHLRDVDERHGLDVSAGVRDEVGVSVDAHARELDRDIPLI
eukprot:37917-Eustigmatos_ZCMA.PRE.1